MIFNGQKHSSFYYGGDKAVLAFSLCQFGEFRVHSIHSLEREKSEMFSSQMSRHEKQLVHSLKTCDWRVEGWVSEALLFDFIWAAIEINNNWPLFRWAVNDVCLKIKSSHIFLPYYIRTGFRVYNLKKDTFFINKIQVWIGHTCVLKRIWARMSAWSHSIQWPRWHGPSLLRTDTSHGDEGN